MLQRFGKKIITWKKVLFNMKRFVVIMSADLWCVLGHRAFDVDSHVV